MVLGAFGGCGKGKWSPKSRGGQWGERNTRAKHFRDHIATQALRRRCSRGRKSQAEALIKDLRCPGDIPLLRHPRARSQDGKAEHRNVQGEVQSKPAEARHEHPALQQPGMQQREKWEFRPMAPWYHHVLTTASGIFLVQIQNGIVLGSKPELTW